MDEELKDRFKALKAIQDVVNEFDKEEQKEIRKPQRHAYKLQKKAYCDRDLQPFLDIDFSENSQKNKQDAHFCQCFE